VEIKTWFKIFKTSQKKMN